MKSDKEFVADWKRSQSAVGKVADWASSIGVKIDIPSQLLRPESSQRFAYSDSGDLYVSISGVSRRVEVKHRKIDFTSGTDYPFSTVIVDERYKIEKENLYELFGYVIVNKSMSHIAVIGSVKFSKCVIENRWDYYQKRQCDFVCCPVNHVNFFKL